MKRALRFHCVKTLLEEVWTKLLQLHNLYRRHGTQVLLAGPSNAAWPIPATAPPSPCRE